MRSDAGDERVEGVVDSIHPGCHLPDIPMRTGALQMHERCDSLQHTQPGPAPSRSTLMRTHAKMSFSTPLDELRGVLPVQRARLARQRRPRGERLLDADSAMSEPAAARPRRERALRPLRRHPPAGRQGHLHGRSEVHARITRQTPERIYIVVRTSQPRGGCRQRRVGLVASRLQGTRQHRCVRLA